MKSSFLGFVLSILLTGAAGCASTGAVEPTTSPTAASLDDWSNVQKLRIGTGIRVTEADGDKSYGGVMVVTSFELTLELVDGSKAIARDQIVLVERFPASVPTSLPGAAVGIGAALTLSSSATPDTYRRSVAAGTDTLDKESFPITNGYYVDALGLVGRSVEWVDRAIESSRTTVVVYRR
jgi:hypothetical protein